MNSGREVAFRGATHREGDFIVAPDDEAQRWIDAGLVSATLRSKPVAPPRPLSPRANGKA